VCFYVFLRVFVPFPTKITNNFLYEMVNHFF